MRSLPSTPERCKLLLNQWRDQLTLTNKEKHLLAGEIKALDRQLDRLLHSHLRIAAFGRVGVGKSSLLNALLGRKAFLTDIAHGCTRHTTAVEWDEPMAPLEKVELIDTPGIDEVAAEARTKLSARIALQADLILFVLDSDITSVELEALSTLTKTGKPLLLVLNRCDQWSKNELNDLRKSILKRLPINAREIELHLVAAAPRIGQVQRDGRIRSQICSPRVEDLQSSLKALLRDQGELFLSVNSLRQADHFYQQLKLGRLKRSRSAAQGLIGKFAAIKASGVAINPLLMLDLAGGLACDTALVLQLSNLYGLQMKGHSARKLLRRLSCYNAYLGGAQIGVQVALGALRQILLLAIPITGGLSIAPAAPIALAQAALAVHTTKLTGRITAQVLLTGSQNKEAQPSVILKRLVRQDPALKNWLNIWSEARSNEKNTLQALLP